MAASPFAKLKNIDRLFILTVVIPVVISIFYFGMFASDVYISETKFVVRSPEKPAASGLGVILQTAGFPNAGNEVFAAKAFLESRDALRALNKGDAFKKAYSDSRYSTFNRFPEDGSFEDLYKYYGTRIKVESDATTAITTLTVRAFSPQDAQRIGTQLLEMAEATVNHLNERGRKDLVGYSLNTANNAKEQARQAAVALAAYRNREGLVDPEKQALSQMQMISKLQDELIATRAQLSQFRTFTPQNPQIPILANRAEDIRNEIAEQTGLVAGSRKSLAAAAVEYQRLMVDNQFAEKQLGAALAALQDARNEASRKQAYVERIAVPNLPDDALEPRRLRGVIATFALGMLAWGILSMLLSSLLEHRSG